MMSAAVGPELVTERNRKEALLLAPEIHRRLVSVPDLNNSQNFFLQQPDGPAMIAKTGVRDYTLIAPSLEEAPPYIQRVIDWVFYETDALTLWFDSENDRVGAALGAQPRGSWSKLTRENGRIAPKSFWTWRLSGEARLENHNEIRVEGGRRRRELVRAGGVLGNIDKQALDKRLGFLSLTAAGGQLAKGIATYNEFAVLRGLPAIRFLAKPIIEFQLLGVPVQFIHGKLELAARGAAEFEPALK